MSTTSAAITDSKFKALKEKLRELFELDKSDLDFGIYRIIAAKNKEVNEFLDRQLKDVVRATLAEHGAGATDQVQAELEKAIEQARTLGADPETLPRVKELRGRLETAGGAASADLEADIYNHLYAFFGRYYEEGDFISQRRYKGDTYAIPYSGEEVTLHWANKDQYYIKSGEWHKDYRFRVGEDKTVRFKLVEATQEVGNNKEADDSKRRYILANHQPIEETSQELTLRFEFRTPNANDSQRAAIGAVVVFGGDYAKATNPKKGDPREQFCADAELRAVAAMSSGWRSLVATAGAAATNDKPARTLLGKHLDHFSARNTFDYFIHKDLGGFLRRELDFYIKNEVVRLDDLETLPIDHLQRIQGKVKAIRTVASRIIAFLAAIEDFQKKMWLKKKFVLNTSWLVTVDRIPPALRDVVAANKEQWAEWEKLGFRPEGSGAGGLFGGAAWGTRAYLDACDKLVLDTRFFRRSFVSNLLAQESVGAIERASLLINGDNFQAVRTVGASLRSDANSLYLDPPYNTDAGPIMYKNALRRSSWMAMVADRLTESRALLRPDGVACVTIDDYQLHELSHLLDQIYGSDRELGIALIRNNPSGRSTVTGFSVAHEYALFYGKTDAAKIHRLPRSKKQLARFTTEGETLVDWRNFRKDGGDVTHRSARPKQYYPLFVHRDSLEIRVPRMTWNKAERVWEKDEDPGSHEIEIYPVDDKRLERVWSLNSVSARAHLRDLKAVRHKDGTILVLRRHFPSAGILPRTWWSKRQYAAREHGTAWLKRFFGARAKFSFAKAPDAVADCLLASGVASSPYSRVVDFFGGSGTTGHAICILNRRDGSERAVMLVEVGRYFHTVLRPRFSKSLYSPDWRMGKAKVHNQGLSALVKSFALESYEDALNNLPVPSGTLLDGRTTEEKDALITYSLDLELGPSLLNLDAFRDPWGYSINAQLASDVEMKRHRVDLVETFNYLIGLKVHAYGPMERYSADFERVEHADCLGRLKVAGRLRRDAEGPYVFQRVEGELNPASNGGVASRVLVVWRKLSDAPEKDAAVLDAWMTRHRESTRERSEHRDYHLIYINGPVTLPQPTAEIRTVYPTEETFKLKMFEDTEENL